MLEDTFGTHGDKVPLVVPIPTFEPRKYQLEMLEESLRRNIVIALDTGAGKTHIAVLRMKYEIERESRKVSWFLAPTVALARQQQAAIAAHLPVSVGLISGANEPDQWRDRELWHRVLDTHRIVVSTHDVLLNALRHGYVHLGADVGLLVFDEAHHAADKHPYNLLMREFYDALPRRVPDDVNKTTRPMVLGLTASPIFGGNAERAFRQLELNLDSIICAPLLFRGELEGFVHRPHFKHVIYAEPDYLLKGTPPSKSLQSLKSVVASMNIEEDPWVLNLRAELRQHEPGPKRNRIDQRLSRAIDKHDSFTHKGLRDFERAADEICSDLGEWAADWYIHQVCKHATDAGKTFPEFAFTMNESEKKYLLGHLSRVEITPIPDDNPEEILRKSSDKVEKLIDTLLKEKASFEENKEKAFFEENEEKEMNYRGIVFVTRRDAVLALTEILARHPRTAQVFTVGSLLGESGNSRRRSFLDITRRLLRQPPNETLEDFRIGDLNLIVATAVAEEGLDIQACCNVVRWDVPPNMVSWAQSRGRARQKRSSFVLMFSDSLAFEPVVRKWEEQEKEMSSLYNTRSEYQVPLVEDEDADEDGSLRFSVDATGAVLTGNSAIEHIFHFCSILPYSGLANNSPQFDIDPPDYPLEWHADRGPRFPYIGSYGCTLTLPRLVDPRFRSFSTPRIHPTKVSARRHVAFQAYRVLYENKLLNDYLLPLTSTPEPDQESEVQLLLKDVEKREGTALVSSQMDPWHVSGVSESGARWWSITLEVDGLPPLRMLTQAALPPLKTDELPVIHTREYPPFKVRVVGDQSPIIAGDDDGILARAKEFTRRLFWPMYNSRMKWDQTDFLHLFIPVDESPNVWDERRVLASDPGLFPSDSQALFSTFSSFMRHYGQVDGIHVVSGTGLTWKIFKFIRMRNTPITIEEKADLVRRYVRRRDDNAAGLEITYPLIEARPIVKRNFLNPMPDESKGMDAVSQKTVPLLQHSTMVALISSHEVQYALWTPSIIRHLQVACTVSSMRDTLFIGTPLAQIPSNLLLTAITMPVAKERSHYQRLETLGDTTLKYVVSIQLLSAHPLWHEGYLARRKDHAVSNANLAKMAIERKLYKWIIRDIFIPKKWKPRRASDPAALVFDETSQSSPDMAEMTEKQKRRVSVARNLSTKVLADVVEALIGAAYFHGGFATGIECMKVFDLDLSWRPLSECIDAMYSRVIDFANYPTQIAVVEGILGYTFRRKTIAVEALTHASYQSDLETISYERMEFLGDAVLDMLVTDYLYRAPGNYSPGNIHSIKTAVVNAHFLAMLCLRASTELPVVMPAWSQDSGVTVTEGWQRLYLYRCLLHSNVHILDEQRATFARWERPGGRDKIEAALAEGRAFPWSALTSLQAPKFLSDMFESLLGAVYLDSRGDLDIVRDVLGRLGHWEVLERIVNRDTDVQHPVSRLYMWAGRHHEKVKCSSSKRDGKMVSCSVLWDDYEITKVEDEWRGRISQEDVRFKAAEEAIALLEDPVSLLQIWLAKRDRSIDYSTEEAGGVWTCTAIVDSTRIATVQSPVQPGSGEKTVTDLKRAAAAEAFKKLEEPVHWLAFLSVQHDFEVGYQIYEEEGRKVCCVHVDGYEASRVKDAIKGAGTERDLMRKAAKEAIEGVELQIATRTEGSSDKDWEIN